ncbi:MAG: agmatine deiminase family protein [Rickettsiales bacterium]
MNNSVNYDYLMPAEWEKHNATLLAWPHNRADWPDKFSPIIWVYGEIIRYLTRNERVVLLLRSEKDKQQAVDVCERCGIDASMIDFYIIPTNRVWVRDSGTIMVRSWDKSGKSVDKNLVGLDFRFNAWAKYPNYRLDDKIPSLLSSEMGFQTVRPEHKGRRVVLEGGSIDVNGCGSMLTTEECLLSKIQERNPSFGRKDYEEVFAKYLGVSNIIWLKKGIVGDDTHGHVDDISRFVNADTVVTVVEKNKNDDNYQLLKDNLKILQKSRDQDGKQINVIEIPMPAPVVFEGQRLPASYANFLIANDLVLVPTFNDPADRIALSIISEIFPKREIVGIHAVDLVWGLGTIHCMSQQIPAR